MSGFFRPEIQTLARAELRALQEDRLRALVRRIFDQPIGFFRDKLTAAGLGPDDIKSLDDLPRVPRTVKQELRDDEASHPPFGTYRGAPLEACVRVSTSSGTTGRPTITLFTPHDLEVEYDAGARMFHRQGRRAGEIITHAHPGGLNGGQALLGGVIEHFGCLNIAVGPPMSKQDAQSAVRLWAELKPHHYEMFGPALHTFYEAAKELGYEPERDLNMPAPKDMPPYRTMSAGLDCFAFLGSACVQDNGAHACEDEAIVECVDPVTGEPMRDGRRGHLVVTSLTKDNAMLRYDLQDIVRLDRTPCPCGETHARAFWEGRAADIVRAAGKELLPNDVWHILRDVPEVAEPALEFQMVRGADTSLLRIRVEAAAPSDGLAARISALLQDGLDVPVALELLNNGALPRPFYKPARAVDEP